MHSALMPIAERPAPLSEVFDRLFGPPYAPSSGGGSAAVAFQGVAANVWETSDGYQVAFLVPGVDPASIQVTAVGDALTVAGEFTVETPEGGKAIWQEFGPAKFTRRIGLPAQIDAEKIEATYRDGILLLLVPKSEAARPTIITVKH